MKIEGSRIDWNLQFFHVEFANSLITYEPRIEKKFTTFILSKLSMDYFQILRVLSVLPLKMVSVFFE